MQNYSFSDSHIGQMKIQKYILQNYNYLCKKIILKTEKTYKTRVIINSNDDY